MIIPNPQRKPTHPTILTFTSHKPARRSSTSARGGPASTGACRGAHPGNQHCRQRISQEAGAKPQGHRRARGDSRPAGRRGVLRHHHRASSRGARCAPPSAAARQPRGLHTHERRSRGTGFARGWLRAHGAPKLRQQHGGARARPSLRTHDAQPVSVQGRGVEEVLDPPRPQPEDSRGEAGEPVLWVEAQVQDLRRSRRGARSAHRRAQPHRWKTCPGSGGYPSADCAHPCAGAGRNALTRPQRTPPLGHTTDVVAGRGGEGATKFCAACCLRTARSPCSRNGMQQGSARQPASTQGCTRLAGCSLAVARALPGHFPSSLSREPGTARVG